MQTFPILMIAMTVMDKIDALVEPKLLIWARKSRRYDIAQAAEKIGISIDQLTEWENGDNRPTVDQLLKMADIYERPLAAFYLPKPPDRFDMTRIRRLFRRAR